MAVYGEYEDYCPLCGNRLVAEDVGIGHYECHGFKGYDSRMTYFCECYDEEVDICDIDEKDCFIIGKNRIVFFEIKHNEVVYLNDEYFAYYDDLDLKALLAKLELLLKEKK